MTGLGALPFFDHVLLRTLTTHISSTLTITPFPRHRPYCPSSIASHLSIQYYTFDSPPPSSSHLTTINMAQSDSEPQARTMMQQEKLENAKKQARREAGLQSNRSRSQSRRDRRRRILKGIEEGKYMKTASLEALEEADANNELNSMQAFERIGPDSTSMDGPVTKARALRGEIPMRGTDPNQPYRMDPQQAKKGTLDDQEGLKLKLEANLEVEIELKASIRGDLTLSLFA